MINFKMIDRGIPRKGYNITDEFGNKIGNVTSGTFSPSNKIGIGIGYINKNYTIGDNIFISIRDKKSQNISKNRVLVPTQKSLQMVPTCGQAETVRKVALASRYFERLSKKSNAIVKASSKFM
mgnify:CR=1 FL=1